MNILNIEHVSKVFGEKVVLDDVSYGVHQGDKIGIIGINGTGKSTILKIIGGLEEPDEGQVITQNGLRITYLPQMPEFPQGASVLDYVAEGKWQKDWSTESEARNVLNKLGITDHEEKIDHLSGGQKKRVALARTLVNPCDVLLPVSLSAAPVLQIFPLPLPSHQPHALPPAASLQRYLFPVSEGLSQNPCRRIRGCSLQNPEVLPHFPCMDSLLHPVLSPSPDGYKRPHCHHLSKA